MRLITYATAIACTLAATATKVNADVTVVGIGSASCATAFLPGNIYQTRAWIYGFWSARNWSKDANVGSTTDANGIVGEVENSCKKSPSTSLMVAVNFVFDVMESEHR